MNSQDVISPLPRSKNAEVNACWKIPQASRLRVIDSFFRIFTGTTPPTIRQVCDAQGNSFFEVFDQVTQRSHRFDSESDLQLWLQYRDTFR